MSRPMRTSLLVNGGVILELTTREVARKSILLRLFGWQADAWVLVAIVMIGRIYVGAHNPLDVVCGAALGVALGMAVNLLLGAPVGRRHRAAPAADMSRSVPG